MDYSYVALGLVVFWLLAKLVIMLHQIFVAGAYLFGGDSGEAKVATLYAGLMSEWVRLNDAPEEGWINIGTAAASV